jgi:8-oxo-dGTP diphosphatase
MRREGPRPTVDVVIEVDGGIVLIRRKHPPHGWALPVAYRRRERNEDAARREMRRKLSRSS